jgi:hypothetical protein
MVSTRDMRSNLNKSKQSKKDTDMYCLRVRGIYLETEDNAIMGDTGVPEPRRQEDKGTARQESEEQCVLKETSLST